MPSITDTNATIKIMSKHEKHLANVTKVTWTPVKGKSDPLPKAATIILYGVDMLEQDTKLPKVFDILCDEDNGVIQKRTRLLNCEVQGDIEGTKTLAIATASDVSVQKE